MVKILFINGHLKAGGVEKSLISVLKNLDYERCEVHVLLLEEMGDYTSELPKEVKVHLKSLQGTYGSFMKCLLKSLRKHDWFSLHMRMIFLLMKFGGQRHIRLANKLITDGEEYDTVIGFRSGICTQVAAYAVKAKRKITWWHHGEINVNREEYRKVCREMDSIVSVSNSCREMLQDAFPELRNKICVIPNMVDVVEIQEKSKAFYPYNGSDELHIVTVGRLAEEKHIENCMYAAFVLKQKNIKFKWHIVGDGALRLLLEQLAISQGVADEVVFEGNQPNPYPYMVNATLMAHPSYVESQGLVILEALALGVPCVVTKSRGPLEFIEDGWNGVFTEQDQQDFAQKVNEVVCNLELQARLRKHARLPETYTVNCVMKEIDKII